MVRTPKVGYLKEESYQTTMFITIVGFLAAALTTFAFLPQMLQTWRTRQTRDISLKTYLALTSGIIVWLIYGLAIQSPPVYVANLVTLFLTLPILYLKLKCG